ncbi:MAG: hypothetical protein GX443_01555 [Deltaproteobacteria bacterium]|nr:hypothetical protein [Deltaproteobacteria bacterium]
MVFYTEMYTPGGFTSHYVEALETETDREGTFHIPAYRAWKFRFPHQWDPNGYVTIFKPGYGAYSMRLIPPIEDNFIELPKLLTRKERRDNLGTITHPGIPQDKLRKLIDLEDTERNEIRLLPGD